MAKNLEICVLLDFYGQLLTEKQYNTLDMYYNQDFSLAEIAEECGISRQGARDFIKRGEKQLCDYEEKLGLVTRFNNITKKISEMNLIIDNLRYKDKSEDVERLKILAQKLSDEI